jgi:hypothetical protein
MDRTIDAELVTVQHDACVALVWIDGSPIGHVTLVPMRVDGAPHFGALPTRTRNHVQWTAAGSSLDAWAGPGVELFLSRLDDDDARDVMREIESAVTARVDGHEGPIAGRGRA